MATPLDTVLVVEDDEGIRVSLRDLLEDCGYQVVEAANGREALQQLRGGVAPCLILLDLMMPVMNGWEFRAEQAMDPVLATIPVVLVSADRSVRQHVAPLSAAGFVEKPIRTDTLLGLVSKYCRGTCAARA